MLDVRINTIDHVDREVGKCMGYPNICRYFTLASTLKTGQGQITTQEIATAGITFILCPTRDLIHP
jgi:hypothetical protein